MGKSSQLSKTCGVIASDPYRRRKGVNPVALHSVVFNAQTASGNKSAHLPFLLSRSIMAQGNLKFTFVAVEYFTKWIEALVPASLRS